MTRLEQREGCRTGVGFLPVPTLGLGKLAGCGQLGPGCRFCRGRLCEHDMVGSLLFTRGGGDPDLMGLPLACSE